MKNETNRLRYALLIAVFVAMAIAGAIGMNMNLWGAAAATLQGVQQNALSETQARVDSSIADYSESEKADEAAV